MDDLDNLAIENFREYLRIPSVHPDINYDDCISFIQRQAQSLELPVQVHHYFPRKPVVIVTWLGTEPDLPAILLNNHMDVVPVFEKEWSHSPFGAEIDEEGNIYARGAQDMKCVSIQLLEAIRRLKKANVTLRRTIHLLFVPDEEIGGTEGMEAFVKSKEFKNLNIGFCLGEGIPSLNNVLFLFYGEKIRWVLRIHCPGEAGHGVFLVDNTAGEKAEKILHKLYELRAEGKRKLENDPNLTIGDITFLNLTAMEGGVQSNVVPPEFTLVVDCRISREVDLIEFEQRLNKWCQEAGEGVWIEFEIKDAQIPVTKIDESNSYWITLKEAFDNMNLEIKPVIFAGTTDCRLVRAVGIPAFGFSPMTNTPILAHKDNEYLNKDVFLRGIDIYRNLISALGNMEDKRR